MTSAATASVDLDPDTSDRLRKLADDRQSAPRALIKEAVEQYVDREEKRQAFHADARKAWRDYQATGLHLTEDEADDWLKRLADGDDLDPPECHG